MPGMALHNVKVPVAGETSPYLCQAALFQLLLFTASLSWSQGRCMLTRDLKFHREILCCPKAPEDSSLPVSWSPSHTLESWAKDRIFCQEFVPMSESTDGSTCETAFVLSSVLISGAGTSYILIPRSKLGVSSSSLNSLVQNLIYSGW